MPTHTRAPQLKDDILTHRYVSFIMQMGRCALALYDVQSRAVSFRSPELNQLFGLAANTQQFAQCGYLCATHEDNDTYLDPFAGFVNNYLESPVQPEDIQVAHLIYPLSAGSRSTAQTKWVHQRVIPFCWDAEGRLNSCLLHFTDITDMPLDKRPCAYLAPTLNSSQVANSFGEHTTNWQGPLTVREAEVLALLLAGKNRLEISQQLRVSIHTVDTHKKNILYKTGIPNLKTLFQIARKKYAI